MDGRGREPHERVDEAPGWDALERRVHEVLPAATEAQHWASDTLPDQDGVYGISAYLSGEVWLYLTFGLSELFDKVSEAAEVSGWGFELTMRVPSTSDRPPSWPVSVLTQLGRYVFENARPFGAGHRIGASGLVADDANTALAGLAFAVDPELGEIETPYGRVQFLTAVGVTEAELELMRSTSTATVLDDLLSESPLLVTDPDRR